MPESREGIRAGTRDVVFRLDPGLTSAGRLADASGKPLPNVQLQVRPESGLQLPLYPKTDGEGRFVMAGLPDENIQIRATIGNRKATWEIRAGDRDIRLQLD